MNRFRFILILLVFISLSCQNREMRLRTAKTSGLVRELLTKLDSADFYAARKEAEIEACKKQIGGGSNYQEQYKALYDVAEKYSHYNIDSSLVYFNRAVQVAADADDELLRIYAQIRLSTMLTIGGFYMEAAEILNSVPREALLASHLAPYYNACMTLYREVKDALLAHRTIAYSFDQMAGEESLLKALFNACITAEFVRVDSKGRNVFNLTNMSSLPFAVSIGSSNPAWIEPFSTVPFKVGTDTVELTMMNMWCGEDKHPTVVVKLK